VLSPYITSNNGLEHVRWFAPPNQWTPLDGGPGIGYVVELAIECPVCHQRIQGISKLDYYIARIMEPSHSQNGADTWCQAHGELDELAREIWEGNCDTVALDSLPEMLEAIRKRPATRTRWKLIVTAGTDEGSTSKIDGCDIASSVDDDQAKHIADEYLHNRGFRHRTGWKQHYGREYKATLDQCGFTIGAPPSPVVKLVATLERLGIRYQGRAVPLTGDLRRVYVTCDGGGKHRKRSTGDYVATTDGARFARWFVPERHRRTLGSQRLAGLALAIQCPECGDILSIRSDMSANVYAMRDRFGKQCEIYDAKWNGEADELARDVWSLGGDEISLSEVKMIASKLRARRLQ